MEQEKKKFASQRKFKEASACQASLKSLQIENDNYSKCLVEYQEKKASIEAEVSNKQAELDQFQGMINELTEKIEREQQKFLMYRCYDISDMIKVLKPFSTADIAGKSSNASSLMQNNLSAKDAKAKKHALELELIKMQ